jgi:glutamate-ammonia-ligase adenylyltransferase
MGPFGRLYELDSRLRPTGKSGLLAVSLDELDRYFAEGRGQLWERQALCKARPIFGTPEARERAMRVVHKCLTVRPWSGESAEAIRNMRMRLQETASPHNLKRGPGGTVDIEFTVQMLQLKWASQFPKVLTSGTLDAICELQSAGCLDGGDGEYLSRSYRFLRSIESGLRLMNTTARHDLPEDSGELKKLAFLLGHSSGESLWRECRDFTRENRARFDRIFDRAARDD